MATEPTSWTERDWTVAPGEILLEALEDRNMSQSDLARRMGRPIKTINEIVNGKAAITPDTAIQLELSLGIAADVWNNLETTYRSDLARARSERELEGFGSWPSRFPVRDLERHNLIEPSGGTAGRVASLLAYFRVSTPSAWEQHWLAPGAAFRSSPAFESSPYASAAWLRWGELAAEAIETQPFDPQRFHDALREIREFTARDFTLVRETVQELCANSGVAFVVTPELTGTHVSGAARWLANNKAILQVSLRHKTDDQLWFSFFHEARHLLEKRRVDFVDSDAKAQQDESRAEEDADRFARDILVPPADYQDFVRGGTFTPDAVRSFAKAQRVAPGIIVGRLQRDGHLPQGRLNNLKRRLQPGATT
jgi:HTH-type transcriptional regulator / antitoxin HigA